MKSLRDDYKNNAENDARLSGDIRNKDKNAFVKFADRFHESIFYECLRSIGDTDEVYDHVNEILLKCYRSISKYDNSKSMLSTWVTKLTKNYLRDFNRIKKRRPVLVTCGSEFFDYLTREEAEGYLYSSSRKKCAGGGKKNEEVCIKKALSRMKKSQQLVLRYRSDDFSYREIAELMGITVNAAMCIFKRAVPRLKQLYYEELGEEMAS